MELPLAHSIPITSLPRHSTPSTRPTSTTRDSDRELTPARYPYNSAQNGLPGKGIGGYQVPAPGDTAHQFVAPGPNDIRGPCPGLNTAANHNVSISSPCWSVLPLTASSSLLMMVSPLSTSSWMRSRTCTTSAMTSRCCSRCSGSPSRTVTLSLVCPVNLPFFRPV